MMGAKALSLTAGKKHPNEGTDTDMNKRSSTKDKDGVFLTIVVPLYNRANLIRRCLDSIVNQTFNNYEIIIVDDASDDDSVAVVQNYATERPQIRIQLIKNSENRGAYATKGIGAHAARGRWITVLDSDDTFKPEAFQLIHDELCKAPTDVGEVRFCYWSEQFNRVTPEPLMPEGKIGLSEYLRWIGEVKHSDLLYCHRKEIYDDLVWPEDRTKAALLRLRIAARHKILMSKQVVGTMHDDAGNRITRQRPDTFNSKIKMQAYDLANEKLQILKEFGDEIKRNCPHVYKNMKENVGYFYFRAGCRTKACRYHLPLLFCHPFSLRNWGRLLLGLAGPKAVCTGPYKLRSLVKKFRLTSG